MHHYGEDSTKVFVLTNSYRIDFINKVTGVVVAMEIPIKGAGERPDLSIKLNRVEELAGEVAHVLRQRLE